jgi:hypothetical protein
MDLAERRRLRGFTGGDGGEGERDGVVAAVARMMVVAVVW